MARMLWFWNASFHSSLKYFGPLWFCFAIVYINAFVKNSHNRKEWMLQWYRRNSEGTSKQFTETQFSPGKGKRQMIFKYMALKLLNSIISYFYNRCNVQVVTHSYSGVNEAQVQGVGFSNGKGAHITRNKNAGSCDFHKLIAAKPLDLKGYDGHLNCTGSEHSKLWCKLCSLCNWSFMWNKTAIAGLEINFLDS